VQGGRSLCLLDEYQIDFVGLFRFVGPPAKRKGAPASFQFKRWRSPALLEAATIRSSSYEKAIASPSGCGSHKRSYISDDSMSPHNGVTIAILAASMLMGCASAAPPDPWAVWTIRGPYSDSSQTSGAAGQRPTTPPAPQQRWTRMVGPASENEFQRTKARCLTQAEMARSQSFDPNSWAQLGTRQTVLNRCMRSEGWVLVRN